MIYKDDIEAARQRTEAWWNQSVIDRAAIMVGAPRSGLNDRSPSASRDSAAVQPNDPAEIERYFTDPDIVIPRLRRGLETTFFGGERFPVMSPVAVRLAAITAFYLGCPVSFQNNQTVWTHPIIHNWTDAPDLKYDPENKWWKLSKLLLETAADQSDGYFISVPELNGPTEILSRLRGPEALAMDFCDYPEKIRAALDDIGEAWFQYWKECAAISRKPGGYFFWMGIWSDLPAMDLQSDFSCMISSDQYNKFFIPSIEEQTRRIDRTVYHLDGPGAVKHLDALLELPLLTAVQWVKGAGSKPLVEWIPLLKKIQDAGKSVVTGCRKEDVQTVLEALKPEGLMLSTSCASADEAKELLRNVGKWTKGGR